MKKAYDLTGKKFGKLTVESLVDEFYSDGGRLQRRWKCKCDCGNEVVVLGRYLTNGGRTYCGECKAPPWANEKHRLCRKCEWSAWNAKRKDWDCTKGYNASAVKKQCDGYWCSAADKLSGVKHRSSECIICGKPVYAYKGETPIYCYEHRAQSDRDNKILDEAPRELLFCLIQAIFERARDDYLTDAEGQRSDAEVFLRGEWARILAMSDFDADEVIQLMDEELYESK